MIDQLRKDNFPVYSIRENHGGISDSQVLEIAFKKHGIILTEDKDFGEWIFS